MEKKNSLKIGLGLLGVIFLIGGLWYWTEPEEVTTINSDILLFYGRECSHCQEVDKFLEENRIAEKVPFNRLEVFHNAKNGAVLSEKAQQCGIENEKEIGVPLVYIVGENKCLIGRPEIEDFFAEKAQLK